MPNYKPKAVETMRALGRLGGKKSGEVRRKNALMLKMVAISELWQTYDGRISFAQATAEFERLVPTVQVVPTTLTGDAPTASNSIVPRPTSA